jgi:hypothetical protein
MTSIFVGGAITSVVTGALFDAWGWTGVTIFAAILPAAGALIWLEGRGHEHRPEPPVTAQPAAHRGSPLSQHEHFAPAP